MVKDKGGFNQARMLMKLALAEDQTAAQAESPGLTQHKINTSTLKKPGLDLNNAFYILKKTKTDLEVMTFGIDEQIAKLQEEKERIAAPFKKDIENIEAQIRAEIDSREESFKCDHGQAIFRRGAVKITWNDKALLGFAAAGHPEIEQFRSETEGKSSTVLKVVGF